jgi:hypothetical protein
MNFLLGSAALLLLAVEAMAENTPAPHDVEAILFTARPATGKFQIDEVGLTPGKWGRM